MSQSEYKNKNRIITLNQCNHYTMILLNIARRVTSSYYIPLDSYRGKLAFTIK
ncbi:protein of unknown function [Petrocella atlantisensis]|uniref:Uncharacterized protein n=1 Tax=Petrocella atlantisensis TaxID=2173034 RepID=A0A3P7NUP1_9FIRM|nr:protein of unknown function [Petrocella atlantisensis]